MGSITFFPNSKYRYMLSRHDVALLKRLLIYTAVLFIIVALVRSFLVVNDIELVENKIKLAFIDISKVNSYLQNQMQEASSRASNSFFRNYDRVKIDWHDYAYINAEKNQTGIGERGIAAYVSEEDEPERRRLAGIAGFNALLSDRIALNRTIPDIRHKDCHSRKYLVDLPNVSVIIPFRREHLSALLRTVHSVINRSPAHLIKEIILVDDASGIESLGVPLDAHLKKYVSKARVLRLPERSGLIRAKVAGAKEASGDVLLFLDSHCEANTNWLPPLLEPIAENYKIVMCPLIDIIEHHTFEYIPQDHGLRGAFDWSLSYKRLELLPEDTKYPSRPFKSPVMAGGLFAISTKYFWELGGYDEGLDIWGGEQYELSFKLWQCGGEMYDAPCSRVGHIYRGPTDPEPEPRGDVDFIHINYKRVAEVWMDEYKEYVYMRDAEAYEAVESGDISKQVAIRQNLQCKSFKWFLEKVAPDVPKMFPFIEPSDYAWGTVQSLAHRDYCLDYIKLSKKHKEIGIWLCGEHQDPNDNQYFALTGYKDIRHRSRESCLDVFSLEDKAPVYLKSCHRMKGNQYWSYDYKKKWIVHGDKNNGLRCLEIDVVKELVFVSKCDPKNKNLLWEWSFYNTTALDNYDTNPIFEV